MHIYSMELPRILNLVQDRVLLWRLVSKSMMMALETNSSMNIKIQISVAGVEHLSADFLRRWNGMVQLECKHPCTPESRWLSTVKNALLSARLRPLSLLNLSIRGNDLHPLVNTLVELRTAIQQLGIAYLGNGKELLSAAAPIASLGHALTMKISVEGSDPGGRQMSLWLQRLAASSIRINSISFRSVRWLKSIGKANAIRGAACPLTPFRSLTGVKSERMTPSLLRLFMTQTARERRGFFATQRCLSTN